MTQNNSKTSAKKIFSLIKEYFLHSDEKLAAWLLLIGAVLCIITVVALMAVLTWWTAGFWAVLTAKALTPFLISLGELTLITAALAGVTVTKNYLVGKLSIYWRNWLTKKCLKELFNSANNYLDLKRFPHVIDNFSQRIQEDIKNFVELTLELSEGILKSALSLGAFTGTLWIVGGSLTGTLLGLNIIIPGFLVWVALIAAITATITTYFIGKSLPQITQDVKRTEADLRKDLTQLNHGAENIAEEHAEGYYAASLEKTLQQVKEFSTKKLHAQTKIAAFQSFYYNIIQYLPFIFSAPLYFAGLIEIGQLMQVGMSFSQVSMSLSLMVESYEKIASCRACIERIVELQIALKDESMPNANTKSIFRKERDKASIKESINIKNLSIQPPQQSTSNYFLRGLNLKLLPGEHVLIKGKSGLGKSTLFKIISGTWQYGDGKITVPSSEKRQLYFLPQFPTMPYSTLRAILAYPEPAHSYNDKQYVAALQAIGEMNDFTSKLNETRDWSFLSGGQQQRISFARALLKKPAWLFLDEATSALDEESEDLVYRALQENLPNTTIVSIGHRSTIAKYHSRVVFFKLSDETQRIVELEDTRSVSVPSMSSSTS